MWMLKWLGVALLMILLLGFSMLNLNQRVDVDLFFWQFQDVPLILVIFEAFIIGMLVWFLVAFINELKLRGELRAVTRDRDEIHSELQNLRNLPLEETEEEEEPAGENVD